MFGRVFERQYRSSSVAKSSESVSMHLLSVPCVGGLRLLAADVMSVKENQAEIIIKITTKTGATGASFHSSLVAKN